MAVGNTFGATALSSYGGFWIAFAIVLTPGGFQIEQTLIDSGPGESMFYDSFGLFLLVSDPSPPRRRAIADTIRHGSSSRPSCSSAL